MKTSVLDQMPQEFSSAVRQSNMSEGHDMLMVPNLDKHMFVRVLEDRGTMDLDPDGYAPTFCPYLIDALSDKDRFLPKCTLKAQHI